MNKACNPLQRKGERSVFCSYYKGCLNHAIKESWPYWDCSACRHTLDQGARQEMQLIVGGSIGHYDLKLMAQASAAVFGVSGEC